MIDIQKLNENDLSEVKEIRDYCLEYLDTPVSFSLEETKKWFKTENPEWYSIRVHDRERLAGYIRTNDYDDRNKTIFIGLDLHPNFRGYGYAFQSYQRIMEKLKVEKNIRRFYLRVRVSNFRAYNLYRKLGFNSIGIIPEAINDPEKGLTDIILMYKNA